MPVQEVIKTKISAALKSDHLIVTNDSHEHAGHAHAGAETHFSVELVSENFEGVGKVARHQMIYKILAHEMDNPIHALVIKAFTPKEWAERT